MKIIIKGNEDAELTRVLCYQQGDTGILFSIDMMFRHCYEITYCSETSSHSDETTYSLQIWKIADIKEDKHMAEIVLVPETDQEKRILNSRISKSKETMLMKYQLIDKETFYILFAITDFDNCQVLYEDLPGIK